MRVSRATDLSVIHATRAWPSALLMCAMCGKRTSARVGAFRLQQAQPAEGEWPPLACSGAKSVGARKGCGAKGGLAYARGRKPPLRNTLYRPGRKVQRCFGPMGVGAGPFAPMQSVGKWAEHRTKAKPNGCGASKCEAWAADFVRHSRLALVRPFFVPRNPERSFSGRVRVWGLFAFSRCSPLKANGLHLRAREPSRLGRGKGVEQKGGLRTLCGRKPPLRNTLYRPER